jgi:hypothetical protein
MRNLSASGCGCNVSSLTHIDTAATFWKREENK